MKKTHGLLMSDSGPVPLVGVEVEGHILGRGARVKVSQRFSNQEKEALEAVYKFPLPEGAAICGFSADLDGRKIHGQVEDRDEAFEVYDRALEKGHGGFLLDQERPNIFTLSVGNLNPGAEVSITIEYTTLLDLTGNTVRFFLPTTISPRYLPDGMAEDNGIPEHEKIHPPYANTVPYGLSVNLSIHEGRLMRAIDSPSHPIKLDDLQKNPVKVSFASHTAQMDRDFILNLEYGEVFIPRAYHVRQGDESFLQLDLLIPEEPCPPIPQGHGREKTFIFLLDCSGSMQGDSITQAKKALEIFLRGLPPESRFNIYRFGSRFQRLFSASEHYSEDSLQKAFRYLAETDADLGGTEILPVMQSIVSRLSPELEQNIIIITDGQVGNEEKIFDLIKAHSHSVRVFSVGIGAGCNEYFMKGLARAGGGASEFIYPGERIAQKVLGLFGCITQNRVDQVSIQWGTASPEQAPVQPALFFGKPATLFARLSGGDAAASPITVKGSVNGQWREWMIDITEADDPHIPVATLWARERIRDLEEGTNTSEGRGTRQKERKEQQVKATIIALSKKYSILSKFASFVAVEVREEKDRTTGELVLRKIPLLVTRGWHGEESVFYNSIGLPKYELSHHHRERNYSCKKRMPSINCCIRGVSDGFSMDAPNTETDLVLEILSLQIVGGGLRLNEAASSRFGIDLTILKKISQDIEIDIEADTFLLLSTAILLQMLENRFPSEALMWIDVTEKSREWLKGMISTGNPRIQGQSLMDWVADYLETLMFC